MSLLLEALKKAALKKKDSEASAKARDDETNLGNAAVENAEIDKAEIEKKQKPVLTVDALEKDQQPKSDLQKKIARDKWLEQHEKSVSGQSIAAQTISTKAPPNPKAAEVTKNADSFVEDRKPVVEAHTEDAAEPVANVNVEGIAEDKQESVSVGNIEFGNSQFSEAASTELKIDDDLDIDANELEILDPKDELGEDVDFDNEDLELEFERDARSAKSKTAMAELLEKSHRVVRRTRRREIYLYVFFFLTAVGSIGAYYYYLSLNDYSLQISKLSRAEEAQIAEHQKSSRINLSDVGGVTNNANKEGVAGQSTGEATDGLKGGLEEQANTDEMLVSRTLTVVNAKSENAMADTSSISAPTSEATSGPMKERDNEIDTTSNEFLLARKISRQITPPSDLRVKVNRIVVQGFNAYERGDLNRSRREYDVALRMAPLDRDALLGAAALASLEARWQDAIRLYQKRLKDYPDDEFARAGLLSLASLDSGNPELKRDIALMLEEYPEAAYLHFIKGAIHASEREWGSAQQAFFDAYYLNRFNADYAFNLGVSMDHLNQKFEAKRYYRLALQLQETQVANFDVDVLKARIAQLEENKQ